MEGTNLITCLCGGMIIAFMLYLASGIRIVPEHRRLAVYRLGVFIGKKGPGLVFLIPIVDRGISIDANVSESNLQSYPNVHTDGKESAIIRAWQRVMQSFRPGIMTIAKQYKTLMNPNYDLGINNIRLRGLTRIIIGILLTAVWVFIALGGASIYDSVDFPDPDPTESETDWFFVLLIGLPFLLAIFTSIHVLWGLVELLLKRSWNQLPSPVRLLLIILIGIPQAVALFAGILYLASKTS